jgi:class 3 adenylate cyclase
MHTPRLSVAMQPGGAAGPHFRGAICLMTEGSTTVEHTTSRIGGPSASALRCALDMLREAAAFSAELEAQGKAPLSVGIGINTGWAIVGNIGSPARMGYTAIGDTVNIASRLQNLTKEYQASLLISQTTFEEIDDLFETEWIGLVTVKGRTAPVGLYKVLGERAPARQATETKL